MNTLVAGPCSINYYDAGEGTPVILLHCSSASHKMWSSLAEQLSTEHRVLAPDLIGYGDSDRWPASLPFDPSVEADIVLQLAERAEGPVHIVGHSYGAAVALEAARQLNGTLLSLTLIEPVAFHLLRLTDATRSERDEIARLADRIRAAFAAGSPRSAAAIYMSFWIGRWRWWAMPNKRKRRIVATVDKVAAEFSALQALSTPFEGYARIDAPTRLIVGGRTPRPTRAVVDILTRILPNARRLILPSAGHMSPSTHARDVHALITDHISAHDVRAQARVEV